MAPETKNPTAKEVPARGWHKRSTAKWAGVALCLAFCWLLAVNAWLSLFARDTLSRKPDKLHVTYQRAWSILPSRLHVRNLRISVQTRRNQWQLQVDRARLHIGLLRLLEREFVVHSATGSGVDFRFRSRPPTGSEIDAGSLVGPSIEAFSRSPQEPAPSDSSGGDSSSGDSRPGDQKRRWRIGLANVELQGLRELWFDSVRVETNPKESLASGGMDVVMKGALSLPEVALHLRDAHILVAGHTTADELSLDGLFRMAPTTSREFKDPATFAKLSADIQATARVQSISMLEDLLPANQRLEISEAAALRMKVTARKGNLLEGSTLELDAPRLSADIGVLTGEGNGALRAHIASTEQGSLAILKASLNKVRVGSGSNGMRFARADRLDLVFQGQNPRLGTGWENPRVLVEMPELKVPDLTAFSDLIPRGTGIKILGGSGVAVSRIELLGGEERSDFSLRANDAQLWFRGTRIEGTLDIAGKTHGDRSAGRLSLQDVQASFRGTTKSSGRQLPGGPVVFDLHLGDTRLLFPNAGGGLGEGLRLENGLIEIYGTVEDLGWWEAPVQGAEWLHLRGKANLNAELRLVGSGTSTRLGTPSQVRLEIPKLSAVLGNWTAQSAGTLVGELKRRRGTTISQLSVELSSPTVGREAAIPLVLPALRLRVTGNDLSHGLDLEGVELSLDAEPTTIDNIAVLTDYLPADRLTLVDGRGTMEGRLHLDQYRAEGRIQLHSERATVEVMDNPLVTTIDLDANLRSNEPSSARFSLRDTTLRLTDVTFPELSDQRAAWWALLDIDDGTVDVSRPLRVDANVRLRLRDTEPIVHLIGASRRSVRWFAKLLEVQNVTGTAHMVLDAKGLRLHNLLIEGDGLRIQGRIDLRDQTAALLIIQLRGLRAGVEIIGDWRDVNVLRPREWFEERSAIWDGGNG